MLFKQFAHARAANGDINGRHVRYCRLDSVRQANVAQETPMQVHSRMPIIIV